MQERRPGQGSAGLPPPWAPTQGSEQGEDPDVQGPFYSRWIWAYYCNSGAWSDGLCVGFQKLPLMLELFCPPLWLRRLYRTLHRAAPLDVRILSRTCSVTQDDACGVATAAFALLVLGCSLGGALCGVLLMREGWERPTKAVLAFALLLPFFLLGALLWGQLLVAVGIKYNIRQVQRWPLSFLMKASSCLCAMNVRVGLHVDRAQGFEKPSRAVRDMVQMAASMGYAQVGVFGGSSQAHQREGRLLLG